MMSRMVRILSVCAATACICSGCGPKEEPAIVIRVRSPAFFDEGRIPKKYTADGPNVSPAIKWENLPDMTETVALICDDPDAPVGTWVHWIVYNIPAEEDGLPEAVPTTRKLESGALQGRNDFGNTGYGGPAPPSGTHRYYFKVYALDVKLELKLEATKKELLKAMKGHILAEGQLMGTYTR